MQIVIDEIDRVFYADVILTEQELEHLSEGYMLPHSITVNRRKCYVGIRLEGEFDKLQLLDDED